jgi:hypothetical protein
VVGEGRVRMDGLVPVSHSHTPSRAHVRSSLPLFSVFAHAGRAACFSLASCWLPRAGGLAVAPSLVSNLEQQLGRAQAQAKEEQGKRRQAERDFLNLMESIEHADEAGGLEGTQALASRRLWEMQVRVWEMQVRVWKMQVRVCVEGGMGTMGSGKEVVEAGGGESGF